MELVRLHCCDHVVDSIDTRHEQCVVVENIQIVSAAKKFVCVSSNACARIYALLILHTVG